ncbi:hydroxyphenylacetyl-CoA thioesterase PaaI [Dethiobacter alkaliphilus]|uniref:Phenylacetic acid degradation protein PaaD n=1 Tax=Dethiobacter alkaliphilus AHT 1 TaxID=555088 RepID=C0GFM1_DETAL|nr:hydroxyphenylacetyl-CoA thioesterase PaaI [Dethiobacter alkaliphilus]EEG77981.1 phenylacetic acid degradation protein PaaD [Dethiobacter alkaliphilus AHT 1]
MSDNNMEQTIKDIKAKFNKDYFPFNLGIEIVELAAGFAQVKFTVTKEMQNLHGMAHGGAIFTLADTALGLAANTRGKAVGLQVSINYIRPAKPQTVLIATAEEEQLTRSTGIYNVTVATEAGKKVALFRGVVFRSN